MAMLAFMLGKKSGGKKKGDHPHKKEKTPGELAAEIHALEVAARRRRLGVEEDEDDLLHPGDPAPLGGTAGSQLGVS